MNLFKPPSIAGAPLDLTEGSGTVPNGELVCQRRSGKRAEIVLTAGGLEARNEKGETSRLTVERDRDIRALDREGGASGQH
jgi:hypothetical protein